VISYQEGVIKRSVLLGFTLFLLIFTTCKAFSPGDGGDGGDPNRVVYTDVVYSSDGKNVTIYLDGTTVPVTNGQSRGLNLKLAKAGHDYFEVVFYHPALTSPVAAPAKTVRAAWELKKNAYVSGVTRNVNYQHRNIAAANSASQGAAILFVGKKTDRTLLAVGRLISTTNKTGGTVANALIDNNTASVTFEVAAFKSGVDITGVGFQTDANSQELPNDANVSVPHTAREQVTIPPSTTGKTFPIFKLRTNNDTYAHYYFGLDYDTNAIPAPTLTINDYLDSIVLAGNGSYGKKQPRYPTANGKFQYSSLRLDDVTVITAVNNIYNPAVTKYFENPVRVTFNTTNGTVPGSSFAYIFEIPVYALSADGSPGTWYIRPSYDSYFLDLDDGHGAAGGAVLIGTGTPETDVDLMIRVVRPPNKWRYSSISNPGTDSVNWGRDFFIDGLEVWLMTRGKPSGTPPVQPRIERRLNIYNDLVYELGSKVVRHNRVAGARTGANAGENVNSNISGIQTVVVKYIEPNSGSTYDDTFTIICDKDNETTYTNIDSDHYYTAWDSNSFLNAVSNGAGKGLNGTYVIVFTASFDIPEVVIGDTYKRAFIFVASPAAPNNTTEPNIRIGRQDTGGNACIISQITSTIFYFGKWPFYTALTVGGVSYHHQEIIPGNDVVPDVTYEYATWGYQINADGVYGGSEHASPVMTHPFIWTNLTGFGGRVYNVTVDKNVKILNDYYFY